MSEFSSLGRILMWVGVVLAAIGALIAWGPRLPWIGRLPGDFVFGGPGWKIYLPLGTCLLLSVIASLLIALFQRK